MCLAAYFSCPAELSRCSALAWPLQLYLSVWQQHLPPPPPLPGPVPRHSHPIVVELATTHDYFCLLLLHLLCSSYCCFYAASNLLRQQAAKQESNLHMQWRLVFMLQASVNCRLIGTIPAGLGQLGKLDVLDLSNNLLTGFLPEISVQMPNLTVV